MADQRSSQDIAAELDEIGGAVAGAYGRRIHKVAAELRGETLPLTATEQREAARHEGDTPA